MLSIRASRRYRTCWMKKVPPFVTGLAIAGLAVALPVLGMEAPGADTPQDVSTGALPTTLPVLPAQVEPAAPARNSAIPEPMSLAVFGTGLLLLLRRRRF
jgi:hypothetical protein